MDPVDGRTDSGRHVVVDVESIHAITGRQVESWPGVARSAVCTAGAVAVAWHAPNVSQYALGVLLLVASPALARAVIAPLLAFLLKR